MTFSSPDSRSFPAKQAVCAVSCACCIESVYVCTPQNPTCGMTCIYMVWILCLRGKTAMREHEKNTSFVERELQYVAALLILRKMRTEGIIGAANASRAAVALAEYFGVIRRPI